MIVFSFLSFLSLTACSEKTSDSETTTTQTDLEKEDSGVDTQEDSPVASEIVLSEPSVTLTHLGETFSFSAVVLDQSGTPMEVPVAWEVSDPGSVSVDTDGTVTAIANGQSTLTASLDSLRGTAEVTVSQVADVMTLSFTAIVFSNIGEELEVTATVVDAGGSLINSPVVWESMDTNIAIVDSGLVTAVSNGTTEITARLNEIYVSVPVQVNATTFSLDSDGLTILCPYATVGETGTVDGIVYTKRDRTGLDALIQDRDWASISTTCTSGIQDMQNLFYNVYETFGDITSWDVSSVTNTYNMFYNAGFFDQDIGHWNVSNVTNMKGMFDSAFMFNQDISDWDVSNVTNFSTMFSSAFSFSQEIGDWDVSAATTMSSMFFDASNFNQDIGGWDVSQVINMSGMFYDASSFNQDLSAWCVSNITSEPYYFVSEFSVWTLPKPEWGTCPN